MDLKDIDPWLWQGAHSRRDLVIVVNTALQILLLWTRWSRGRPLHLQLDELAVGWGLKQRCKKPDIHNTKKSTKNHSIVTRGEFLLENNLVEKILQEFFLEGPKNIYFALKAQRKFWESEKQREKFAKIHKNTEKYFETRNVSPQRYPSAKFFPHR